MQFNRINKEVFTIPNLLSLFRLLLIPVYITIYRRADNNVDYFVAAAILAVSCLTDMIDGQIARRFNMISTIGKILDPLADKLTQFSLILCLCSQYPVLWHIVALFFIKEMFQLIAGAIYWRKGIILKGALISGKICTTVLFLSLIFMVLVPTLSKKAVEWIVIIDGLFLVLAFADYIRAYCKKGSKFQALKKSD